MSRSVFHRFSIMPEGDGFVVYGHGIYEKDSVFAGQDFFVFVDSFATLSAAREAFPSAIFSGATNFKIFKEEMTEVALWN